MKIDVTKFFDNIDRSRLLKKTDAMLDKESNRVIESIIEAPVLINGKEFYREKGILQGFNISPLLANIFLDGFDEYWSENINYGNMVRYSDDILIFASGKKKAKKNLQKAKKQLRDLGLRFTYKDPIKLNNIRLEFLGYQHYIDTENKLVQIPTDKKIKMLTQIWKEDETKDYKKFKQRYSYFYSYNTSSA